MIRTTHEQRLALKRVFDRGPVYPPITALEQQMVDSGRLTVVPLTYKQFRRGIAGTIGMDGAVVIHWAGMWLAIEADGYTHS